MYVVIAETYRMASEWCKDNGTNALADDVRIVLPGDSKALRGMKRGPKTHIVKLGVMEYDEVVEMFLMGF